MSLAPKRLTIPARMFLMLAVVLVVFGGVSVWSLLQHQRTADNLRLLDEGYLPVALTVGEAKATQAIFGTVVDRVMSEPDPTATRHWLQVARRVRPATLERALAGVTRAEQLKQSDADRVVFATVVDRLRSARRRFEHNEAAYERFFDALNREDSTRAEDLVSELRADERSAESDLREARRLLQERIATVSADAAEQERRSALLLAASTVVALLVGMGVIGLAYRMLSPLPRLQKRVEVVARGDLSPAALPRSDDELGRLADAFERMVGALRARDQSLRQAAEAKLRLQRMQEEIVANLSAALVVVDGEGVVRTANPAAARVLGVKGDAVGSDLKDTGLLQRLSNLQEAMERVRVGAERAVLSAVPIRMTDREDVLNVIVTPFVTDDPTDTRSLLLVAEDVTEELRTKNRLIQSERLAAIGRMAAHVTHEVRNPLSSIGLNVELLEEELSANVETKALLRAIQKEIDRLTKITEEYLRLARLPQPQLEPGDVGSLIDAVAGFIEAELQAAGVTLETDVAPGLPPVALDESQLRQALLNLLRNARESMPGGGVIQLRAEPARDGVALCVEDDGSGMDPETRARIFDLFFTTKKRGTGLGLPLTQQIIVAHGGTLQCHSAEDRGTTFELWFPAIGDGVPAAEAPATALG